MFEFEWDPAKAASNFRKHKIRFELAVTIFRDPLMQSILDEEHGKFEERWITLGRARDGRLLVVCHTEVHIDRDKTSIRLISARQATRNERRQYESTQ